MPCWYYEKHELRKTPSVLDGLSFDAERRYRKEGARFIMTCGSQMGLLHNTMATGVVYFHRFYMFHSFKSFPRYVTACCCLFLAGKVEETPKKCRDVIKAARALLNDNQFYSFGEDPKEEVMTLERILLQTIKFDLQVDHPYSFLLKYAKSLKGDQPKLQKMVQMAWNFVNDSLSTTLCLQWEPEIIAVAMIHLASKLSKFAVTDWTGRTQNHRVWWDMFVADITMDILEDICHQMLDFYQTNVKEPEESNSPPQKPPSRIESPPREILQRGVGSQNHTFLAPLPVKGAKGHHTQMTPHYPHQQQQPQHPQQHHGGGGHHYGNSSNTGYRHHGNNLIGGDVNNIQPIKSLASGSKGSSSGGGGHHNSMSSHHHQQMPLTPGYHQSARSSHSHSGGGMYPPMPPPPRSSSGSNPSHSQMHMMYPSTGAPLPPQPPSNLPPPPLPPAAQSSYGPPPPGNNQIWSQGQQSHYGHLPPQPGQGPSTSSGASAAGSSSSSGYYHQRSSSSSSSHHSMQPPQPPSSHSSSSYGRHHSRY